jgi:uncharacterized delta-60 repeat protein
MKKYYFLAFLFALNLCYAQNPAAIDLTFDMQDHKPIFNSEIRKTIVQPDGKILVLGSFTKYSYHGVKDFPQKNLVRLNADMSVDPTFNIGTGFSSYINDIALQSTGKILVLVSQSGANTYNGVDLDADFGDFLRLNADGSLDTTFEGPLYSSNGRLFILPNDKVMIRVGQYLSRANANGTIDNTFTQIAPFGNGIFLTDLISLPSGEIIVAAGTLKKYTAAGLPVPAAQFSTDGFDCHGVQSMTLQPDGKILVMGDFFQYQGSETIHHIVRLNANGSLDTSFNASAVSQNLSDTYNCNGAIFKCAALQPDGKILVGGKFPNYGGLDSPNLIRLNSNGTVDNTFTGGINIEVSTISRQNDGNFIIGLRPDGVNPMLPQHGNLFVDTILKTNSTGTLLNTNVSSQYESEQMILLPNSQVALFGNSSVPYHRGLKLVDTNGNLVVNSNLYSGFSAQLADSQYQSVTAAVRQPDGKFVAGGYFTTYNGVAKNHIARLNADYSIDATFNMGTGFSGAFVPNVEALAVQADGKILVAGSFDNYNGTAVSGGFVRLTATGQLDPAFTGSANGATKIIVQSDGKILLLDSNGITRLNANGTTDPGFTSTVSPQAMALLPNGKIVVADFSKVRRLQADGSIDTTFTELYFSYVSCIYIQPDGKILIGGTFNNYGNIDGSYGGSCRGLARLTANGQFDHAFDTETGFKNTGTGFNYDVKSIGMQSDGKILAAGRFTRYDGAWSNGIVRVLGGDAHVLQGTVRYDLDNDGCETTDMMYANIKLRVTAGSVISDFVTNTSGAYSIPFPAGNFTVTPIFENTTYQTVSPASKALSFPADGIVVNQDFCILAQGIHPDLEVSVLPVTVARPGVNATYKIVYKNKGNQVQSGSVALTFNDAVMDYVSANPSAAMTPNNATWTFASLFPNETRTTSITFNLNTPMETPAVNGGDVLAFSASISPSAGDDTPSDNIFGFNQTVVNSYDPNDKTCLEGATVGTVAIGNYVHYMIRFENKGTYAAQNITVTDVIDPAKFDIATLIPLHGSHSFVTRISGNQASFFFENINLDFADNNNDGYVSFKIKTKSTLAQGNSFSNAASIFFDYNPAILTNTAVTTISMLGVADFDATKYFTVYPNPASHTLNLHKNQEISVTSYSIYNTIGQLLMVRTGDQMDNIDISHLQTGNYFIKVVTDKGNATVRFVKN